MASLRGQSNSSAHVPECVSRCIRESLRTLNYDEEDIGCVCEGKSPVSVADALESCHHVEDDEGDECSIMWKEITTSELCNLVKSTIQPPDEVEPLIEPSLTPDLGDNYDLKVRRLYDDTSNEDDRDCTIDTNTIPSSTKIGMAVGFSVAGLLIVLLLCLYLRERRLRKRLDLEKAEATPVSRASPKSAATFSAPIRDPRPSTRRGRGAVMSARVPTIASESSIWRPSVHFSHPSRPIAAELG